MKLIHRNVDGVDVLAFNGRFDAYEVPAFVAWFEEHPQTKHLVVNLEGVGFIDSSGLSTMVKILKRCRQNGGDLILCNMQQAVFIIFELTRLDKAFRMFDDEQSAVAAVNAE